MPRRTTTKSLIFSILLSLLTAFVPALSFAGGGHEEGAKFDPGKLITGHITDAHDWHLWGEGHSSVSIPLPVIVYSSRGLDVFMSSAFHHGQETYNGYALKNNAIVAVQQMEPVPVESAVIDEAVTASLWDFSITKNVVSLFVSLAILMFLFLSVAKAYTRRPGQAPKGLQSLIEPLVIFVRDDIAKASIGEKKYMKFLPYLLTAFFFIWINNLMGLVPVFPGGANLTGSISVTMTLAVITFLITTVNGNKHYWQGFDRSGNSGRIQV